MRRICVVTAGHLSTCPRMLKAADALAEAGYDIRVVSARYSDWAWQADQDVRRKRSWKWTVVNYQRRTAPWRYLESGVRFHSARFAGMRLGSVRCHFGMAARAYSRAHTELLNAILTEPQDLIYGGTSGALACVAMAAARTGVPYALDLEDFHSLENNQGGTGEFNNGLAERIERAVLADAAFLTAGGEAMTAAYNQKYNVHAVPLNNTHPLPSAIPDLSPSLGPGLRLYWFGQTIGPGKGIDTLIRAVGLAHISAKLHLRGQAASGTLNALRKVAAEWAPGLDIVHHEPVAPDSLVDACKGHDVGLASFDPDSSYNCKIAAPNKPCTYILAGLAVAISDTPGQRPLGRDLGDGAIFHSLGDAETLAAGLQRWSGDKSLLARAKAAAWDAGKRRWHWEHPEERGALLRAVADVFER